MNEVSAIVELPVLMLHCPKCKWRFPVKLPAFASATEEGKFISCAACGENYSVRVELLARDAQQRTAPDLPEQKCPSCDGNGYVDVADVRHGCDLCDWTGISKRSGGG